MNKPILSNSLKASSGKKYYRELFSILTYHEAVSVIIVNRLSYPACGFTSGTSYSYMVNAKISSTLRLTLRQTLHVAALLRCRLSHHEKEREPSKVAAKVLCGSNPETRTHAEADLWKISVRD